MTKLNWSCTSCGMSSSRRFSVQRHIDNYNIHNGLGQVVPFVVYSIGIKEGKYRPQKVPQFTRPEDHFFDRALDKIAVEVENQIVREIARRIYIRISTNQAVLDNLETVATANIISKNVYSIFKGTTF